MNAGEPPAIEPPPPPQDGGRQGSAGAVAVGLGELFWLFFVIGLTACGVAILQSIRSVSVKRGWLSRDEIDEGLGLVQTYPGAMMTDLVTYVGYRCAVPPDSRPVALPRLHAGCLLLVAGGCGGFGGADDRAVHSVEHLVGESD